MADMNAEPLDFSDLGGRRIWHAAERLDFSDIGGRRIGEVAPTGYFSRFGDLGALSVEHHPEWLRQWQASRTSEPHPAAPRNSSQPAKPLNFSDLGGKRVWRPTEKLDFSDIGGRRVGEAETGWATTPTHPPRLATPTTPSRYTKLPSNPQLTESSKD